MNRKTSLVLIGLVLIASAGIAQTASVPPDDKVVTELEPTRWGEEQFRAAGIAAKVTRNGVQKFVARVFAEVPDGTILLVRGTLNDGTVFDLGSIEMLLDSGGLDLRNSADQSQVFPLERLNSVTIEYRGDVMLNGVFDR